jgi:hypothetical protein
LDERGFGDVRAAFNVACASRLAVSSFAFSHVPVEISDALGKVFDPKAASVPAAVRASARIVRPGYRCSSTATALPTTAAALTWPGSIAPAMPRRC